MTQSHRFLVWVMLAALTALMAYFAFRGYLSADMLFNFSNSFSC